MTESNTPHLRAKLPVDSLDGFYEAFGQFILPGRMFLPTDPSRLKSVGDSIQFEVLLSDGSRALAGKGIVRQVRSQTEASRGPAGMVVEYTHLSKRSKALVKNILQRKKTDRTDTPDAERKETQSHSSPPDIGEPQPATTSSPSQESFPAAEPGGADDPKSSLEETTERADSRKEAGIEADPELEADDETLDEMARTGFDLEDDSEVSARDPESDEEDDAGGEFDDLGVSAGAEAALFGDDESDESTDSAADQPASPTDENTPPGDPEPDEKQTDNSGLQVLPYDEDDPDASEDPLSELDFGEDSDVDRMLDNMFSGGGDESGFSEDEAADALFAEAFDEKPAPERKHQEHDEPAPERKHQVPDADIESDAQAVDAEAHESSDADDRATVDELSALAAEPAPESTKSEKESNDRAGVEEGAETVTQTADTESGSGELDEAFRALDEDDKEQPKRRDLKLSIDQEDEPDSRPDDDSLDALIADTQQNLEPVSSESDADGEEGDALDKVLGDDLPDPPSDDFEFDPGQDFRPAHARESSSTKDEPKEEGADGSADAQSEDKASGKDSSQRDKRKGFLSRFFGGDD